MHFMSETESARFIAALDKVDTALTAIRMEFEDLARQSAERLAELRERESRRMPGQDHQEFAQASAPMNTTLGMGALTATS